MKPALKFCLLALLPVIAAAAISCQDDDNWKPTWALPLIKEQSILIGSFIKESDVKEVNDQVRKEWNKYVKEKLNIGDGSGAGIVDSIAYLVLANHQDSIYVKFDNDGPKLNDSIEAKIKESLGNDADVDSKIAQVNKFLSVYWQALQQQSNSEGNNPLSAMAKSKAIAKNVISAQGGGGGTAGGDTAINNLIDAMIHPTDVFITAANVLSAMDADGSYIDSINAQIDSVLQKTKMLDSIAIDFADYVADGSPISAIELDIITTSAEWMPFKFKFSANFADVKGDSICKIFEENNVDLEKSLSFPFEQSDEELLNEIVKNTKYVKFRVECWRTDRITKDILRTLSQKGIHFSVRLKVQAAMSKFKF
ncbi:MAG: hypothetical protein LBJ57_08545 [Prevotellaceae bacterium]|jgi:hypothetical protein|nr:hypothetical protein [Prevotellaceae bacterium]